MIKNLEGKIDKLRTMCSFDTEPLVEFIKDILTMIEKEEYQIKNKRVIITFYHLQTNTQ